MKIHRKWLLVDEFKDSINTKIPNLKVGEVKNSWTIIGAWIDPNSERLQAYKVRCTCGTINSIRACNIKNNASKKCMRCTAIEKRKPIEEIKDKISNAHRDGKYSYPDLNNELSKGIFSTITIHCNIHGVFSQSIHHHASGQGCPKCTKYGIDLEKPTILYYIYFPTLNLWKIGITNKKSVDQRFNRKYNIKVIKEKRYEIGLEALEKEQKILSRHYKFRYKGIKLNIGGETEMFIKDVLNLDEEKGECHGG